jgi:hypothetical protein
MTCSYDAFVRPAAYVFFRTFYLHVGTQIQKRVENQMFTVSYNDIVGILAH